MYTLFFTFHVCSYRWCDTLNYELVYLVRMRINRSAVNASPQICRLQWSPECRVLFSRSLPFVANAKAGRTAEEFKYILSQGESNSRLNTSCCFWSPQDTVSMETDLGSLPWRSLFKLPSLTPTITGIRKWGPLMGFSSLRLHSSALGLKTHQLHSEMHLLVITAAASENRISIPIMAHLFILCSAFLINENGIRMALIFFPLLYLQVQLL